MTKKKKNTQTSATPTIISNVLQPNSSRQHVHQTVTVEQICKAAGLSMTVWKASVFRACKLCVYYTAVSTE